MAVLIKTIQFLAALLILVGIHELGHLLFAKLFKMRVDRYMIGFPPKLFKFKWGETEYALGSVPLGGAVQIAGMVDESLATLQSSPQPWEFRSKPAWQRLTTILGGIIFNLISGILIFIALSHMMGHAYLSKNDVNKYGIVPSPQAMAMGFKLGDQIININGKDFEDFNETMSPSLLLRSKSYYTIKRYGKLLRLPISEKIIEDLSDIKKGLFLKPIRICLIDTVQTDGSAALAGLMAGDQIIELAGVPTLDIDQLREVIKLSLGKTVEVVYLRNGIQMSTSIQLNQETLGIQCVNLLLPKRLHYSFIEAIPVGLTKAVELIQCQFLGIWKLITGKIAFNKAVSGPVGMAQGFGDEFIGYRFWMLVASFSIMLGVANLLPIPALDGGHALFIVYEALSGRKLSHRFLENMQKLGMLLLLLLTLYVLINDMLKLS